MSGMIDNKRAADVLRWIINDCEVVNAHGLVDTSPSSPCGQALLMAVTALENAAEAEQRRYATELEMRLLETRMWKCYERGY